MNKQVSKVPVDRVARPLWRALALVVLSQVGCPDGCGPRQLVRVEVAGDGAGHVYDPLGRWGACFAETSIADHAYDETTPCLISFHPQADGPRKFAAFADPDSRFVGWSGDCVAELGSETVSTIELGTTTDYRCVATFEAETGGAGGSGEGGNGGAGGEGHGGSGGNGGSGGSDPWCPGGIALANPSFEEPVLVPGGSVAPPLPWTSNFSNPVILFPTSGLTQTQPLAAPASGNQLLDLVGSYSEVELATGATTELNATYTMHFAVARPAGSAMPVLNGRFGTSSSASVYYQIPYAELPEGEWISHQVSFAATEVGALFFRVANHATNGDTVYLDNLCLTRQ